MITPMKKPRKPVAYDPAKIEKKWQKKWASSKLYASRETRDKTRDSRISNLDSKFYVLDMFPYPSGEGLHVGHPKGYIATDVISRMKRMQGKSVLHPMGFDAFGLPAENYAIKTKTHPEAAVKKNVARYKEQLQLLGLDYDWSREVNTTDSNYYRWTQWIFLQLYKKGLAFESNEPVNWCPTDKTVLANEDVENGRCERCGTLVEKKPLRQWVLRITDYAERLLKDLEASDYVMPVLVDKVNPHRPGKELVKRNSAHAIVYDPKTRKYLIIRNKKFGWDTVVIGGMEGGEDPVETARREVREETGYTDLEFKRVLGGPTEAHYYTKHKDQNRIAYATAVYFELKSDARVAVGSDEDKDNEILWIDEADFVPGKMVNSELPVWLERLNARVEIDPKTGVHTFVDWGNTSAVREDLPFVERNAVAAVVKHWKEDKYMALQWKKVNWHSVITGGVEEGQTSEDAAVAEIVEETGYLHPKLKRHLGKVDSKFFHNPKNVNRHAHFDVMYFELADGERRELTAEEQENHEVLWLTKEEMSDFLNMGTHRYIWDVLFLGKQDRFAPVKPLLDWPTSIKELQKNWIGKSEGAEIDFPFAKKYKYVLLHGFKGSPSDPLYPWLRKELESRGHTVIIPALPNADKPSEEEQVAAALAATDYDRNTILYGHSLGTVVAMKVAERLDKKIAGLVLAGGFVDPHFKDHPRNFENTFNWKFNADKIRDTCGFITALHDVNDGAISNGQAERLGAALGITVTRVIANDFHFDGKTEPSILNALTPKIKVFTTRPDTLFGVTYVVMAPEHPWMQILIPHIENRAEVEAYILKAQKETEIERTDATKEKTGVELKGIKAVNPANGEEVPVWISDYVLADYGTGAVMAVPAHDERDRAFAKKFNLPIKQVVVGEFGMKRPNEERRDGGCALIFDPKSQKYAVYQRPNGFVGIFGGGVEKGEDVLKGIMREVEEESGLHDFEKVEEVEVIDAHYFHAAKKLNRVAGATCLLAILKSAATKEVRLEDHEDFNLVWMNADEIEAKLHERNANKDVDHWVRFLPLAISRAIELGYDKTSDPATFSGSPYVGNGRLINSGQFNDTDSESAKKKIVEFAGGRWVTKFKLRDWVFSRQRYWGEPIPLIHCPSCGVVPVPEKDLPVKLPKVKSYEPTGTGESPLANIDSWVNVKCPQCKGKARRETNTMPQWAGSCWYYLRFMDPKNKKAFVGSEKEKYWAPVDLYVGGAEHATRHLIYARFWHKVLFDLGYVSTPEPFTKLQSVGLIMGEDGRKMSKRYGNVVNPDDVVKMFGADSLRIYEMFIGPFDQQISWSTDSIVGTRRFIERVWKLAEKMRGEGTEGLGEKGELQIINKTIQKVTQDIQDLRFNTAVSALMIAVNDLEKLGSVSQDSYEKLLKLVAPFAPHATEELWMSLGNKKSIHISEWPAYDPKLAADSEVKIIVQINGKVRGSFMASPTAAKDELLTLAKALPEAQKWLEGNLIRKEIVVPGRLVNLVV